MHLSRNQWKLNESKPNKQPAVRNKKKDRGRKKQLKEIKQ